MARKNTLIKVPFIARDMSGEYIDNDDCPIARATKRFFNWKNKVSVGDTYVRVGTPTGDDYFDIERVIINKRTIALNDGFGVIELEKIRAAFDRNPDTKAHVTLRLNP